MCKIRGYLLAYLLTELHVKLDIFPSLLYFLRLHWSLYYMHNVVYNFVDIPQFQNYSQALQVQQYT